MSLKKTYLKLLGMVFALYRAKINHSFFRSNSMNEHQFDKYLHINTVGEQYGFPKLAHYHRYEPTPYVGLEQLFAEYEMPDNPVFIDMGCGKGRVPIYVHDKFHIPTIGVEMDAGFYAEAENNKRSYLQKKECSSTDFLYSFNSGELCNSAKRHSFLFFSIRFQFIFFVQ